MTVLAIFTVCMVLGIAVSPESFGETLAKIRRGYDRERQKGGDAS